MPGPDLHVVLGATGGIGGAVVTELLARGRRVRAVTRTPRPVPAGAEAYAADLTDSDAARGALDGAAVVHHCAQPAYGRWGEEFPVMNRVVLGAAEAAGARLVFADNLYMYGPIRGPITEATREEPESRKGAIRRGLARTLLDAHAAGRVRVAIGRATDYYGPGGTGSLAGAPLFGDAVRDRPVRWPGDPDLPHALAFLPDVARALVTLGERDEALGRAWVLPCAPALTPRRFVAMVGEALGRPVRLKPTGKLAMRLAGIFVPEARELPDIWYQFTTAWVPDGAAFTRAFAPDPPTPHDEAIARTVTWWRDRAGDAPG
ncbi:MAG: NAD-dependent epimerase/dehydratase family protein [Thermoleophilia bacterium]|nr:NAD-dependent epimerase/dehydratase family protein [Thermoleophilia bacterium]